MPTVQGTATGSIGVTGNQIAGVPTVQGVAAGSIVFSAAQVGTPSTPYARADLLDSTHTANAD